MTELDPRFDPQFQRGFDPAVHTSGKRRRPPAAEPVEAPREHPAVSADSIRGVSTGSTTGADSTTGAGSTTGAPAYFGQYDFSDPAGAVVVDQPEFDSYTVLYSNGSTLTGVASPLLLCTMGATVTLFAVLSARRDGQTGAPAAS